MSSSLKVAASFKTAPLVLRGSAHNTTLSPFRREKLSAAGVALGLPAALFHRLQVSEIFFVNCNAPLSETDLAVLTRLLTQGSSPAPVLGGPPDADAITVLPRLGTVSPWSSKATDIARNCGLAMIDRVERGFVYEMPGLSALGEHARTQMASLVHDRMTESVITAGGDVDMPAIFDSKEPAPLATISVMAHGRKALQDVNVSLGLALAEDEIDYLLAYYERIRRDPTDVELMMFAQANSEHCRHKIFNASWTIDGRDTDKSLFAMIRNTHACSPRGTVVAYSDNSAVMEGASLMRFHPNQNGVYAFQPAMTHVLMKVETHNHPTAIAPWPGAATGAGGEIRDEGATGRGAKPKAGLTGFTVSNLRLPGYVEPWETEYGKPGRIVSALDIMVDGPLGGAAFNNEFGRINLCGYFRTYEQEVDGVIRGYHKPIMIAGGCGNIDARHSDKRALTAGDLFIQLGGPGMRIGLGGGAASSVASGSISEALDFDSVQRANAEMQRRCQEVIDACWQRGLDNPIISIHDVGAGGVSNALPEIAHGGGVGACFDLRAIPSIEPGMSPREIWSNESQERYVLAITPDQLPLFESLCARERCPFAIVGRATDDGMLRVTDALSETAPVDMDMDVLLGKPPRMHRRVTSLESHGQPLLLDEIELSDAVHRVLRLPSVADKTFLISIGDRSVGGLTVRDQFVGPWQVPVADCAVTLMGFDTLLGEAMAIGERTPIAVLDAPASGRMAVGEAITNIAAADVGSIGDIKLSANWMAAVGQPGDDAALYRTVEAVGMSLCPALGIGIPVGKDSLSMRTAWTENGTQKAVAAPVSLIVSAFGVVGDVSLTLTPQISGEPDTELVLIDLGDARARMGGSALAQVYSVTGTEPPDLDDPRLLKSFFAAVRELARARLVLAYHDRSDGGLLACVAEMMFASRCGVSLNLDALVFRSGEADTDDFDVSARSRKLGDHAATLGALFNEELGAVIEIRRSARKQVMEVLRAAGLGRLSHVVGYPIAKEELRVIRRAESVFVISREDLQASWSHVSHQIQSRRDNPATASEENARIYGRRDSTQLAARLSFDATEDVAAPYIGKSSKPRVAILREQGVNGQIEMAHAFVRAGFDAQDVHMSDIIAGRTRLDVFVGLAACGGFSYGDVLGAGEGWAKSALFNPRARDQFSTFFARMDTFALGLCNGCQMLSNLAELIPGADNWPHFERNRSEQYEARTISLEILDSPSILFAGMAGSLIPLPTAHGEGRAVFRDAAHEAASRWLCAARFVDGDGAVAESFPANPNGSPLGMTAFTTPDGRFNIMMPHPERAVLNLNLSWRPATWSATQDGRPAFSPWMRLFRNARKWVG